MKPDDIDEPLHSEDASFHHFDDTDSEGESAASIASKTLLQHGVDDEPARLDSLEEATRNEKRQEIKKTARTESLLACLPWSTRWTSDRCYPEGRRQDFKRVPREQQF